MPDDVQRLREFLTAVETLLDNLVNHRTDVVSADLRPAFQSAWPEAKNAFMKARAALESPDILESLNAVGLTGKQLDLKLAGVAAAKEQWENAEASPDAGPKPSRLLRKFLDWVDTVLGSLSVAVPWVELIAEYKDCVRNDVSD
jgi:hypothetical protein